MATLQEVRDKANAKLATFWGALQTREDAYFAKHGKYFQLLVGSTLTQDGADTTFSVVSPSDEAHLVDIDTSWSDTVPFQIEVHEWGGGYAGTGYKAIATIKHNDTLYRRERDSNQVDTNWYEFNITPNPSLIGQ
jgi:hypothetical protein